MMKRVAAYIGLGSNLEDPASQIKAGCAAIAALPATELIARSALYRSAPVGYSDQPDFINAVAKVETTLDARALLDALLAIELNHGRVRDFPNAPRLYGDLELHAPGLTIPHPRMHERAFVLVPLAEIDPQCVIPGRGKVAELLRAVDAGSVVLVAPRSAAAGGTGS
jgi:2-amino-4-hydroxy-6-hydroxymethyldihydropteridine diphosphokinase